MQDNYDKIAEALTTIIETAAELPREELSSVASELAVRENEASKLFNPPHEARKITFAVIDFLLFMEGLHRMDQAHLEATTTAMERRNSG